MKVHLRAIEPQDLDLLYTIENDVSLWDIGATNVPYSRYTLHDYIATSADDAYADRQVRLMVETADGQTVGIADLVQFDPRHRRAEIGIVILKSHRRRGYATAALQALADYARRILHVHQLYAVIAVGNEAARRLFSRCGYQRQVLLTDWLYDGTSYADALLMQYVYS